ncbi:MAG: glutamate-semialdehyde -aminomutase, partial [Miltoncostaeaceae bacterium]|nr:glutamate-semialdehyde -aminomutase [Miltoncostaeaceae bacterium]
KVIGGGLPCAAYAGPRRLMELISPAGSVYQAGTLSGNPLAMAGGMATLEVMQEEGAYETLERLSAMLADGMVEAAKAAGVPIGMNRVGSMLTPFFAPPPVTDYASATRSDTEAYGRLARALLEAGVYPPPSQYEAWFVSLAHGDAELALAREALARAA